MCLITFNLAQGHKKVTILAKRINKKAVIISLL